MNDPIDITTDRDNLPEGHARFVIQEGDVTTVIQGDAEKVRQRNEQELADALNMTVGEMKTKADDYPMPKFSD